MNELLKIKETLEYNFINLDTSKLDKFSFDVLIQEILDLIMDTSININLNSKDISCSFTVDYIHIKSLNEINYLGGRIEIYIEIEEGFISSIEPSLTF